MILTLIVTQSHAYQPQLTAWVRTLLPFLPDSRIMGNCTFFSSTHSLFSFLAKVQLNPSKQSSRGSVPWCRGPACLLEHTDSRFTEKGLTRRPSLRASLAWVETSLRRSRVWWAGRNSLCGDRSECDWRRRTRWAKKSGGRRPRFSLIDFCRGGWLLPDFCRSRNSKGSDSISDPGLAII